MERLPAAVACGIGIRNPLGFLLAWALLAFAVWLVKSLIEAPVSTILGLALGFWLSDLFFGDDCD